MKGFKAFLLRGNVVELAVAVVIGVAFGLVVTAFVKDLVTPLVAALFGKPDFGALTFTINSSKFLYGDFINTVLAFLIVAAVISPIVLVLVGSLYWQLMAGIRAVAQTDGDRSTTAAYYHPLRQWLSDHDGRVSRIEVPPTSNHWESAYLAPTFGLARGWLRQLDTTRDDLFYDGHLTQHGYRIWLQRNAVRYVALPDAPLDYSARAERALILRGLPYLRPRWSSAHWRVFEVRHPGSLVVGDGYSRGRLRANCCSCGTSSNGRTTRTELLATSSSARGCAITSTACTGTPVSPR